MLAAGAGKNRASRSGGARKSASWRVLFLSSGEISLADKIAENYRDRKVTAGQQVRLIEIPAATGVHGLFEDIHKFEGSKDFAQYLDAEARKNYGTAARAFIEKVIEAGLADVASAIKKSELAFVKEHCPKEANSQVQRVAGHFGFVVASGELAIEYGILPWEAGTASKGVETCFKAWLEERGSTEPFEVSEVIRRVRDFISRHGSSRFQDAWGKDCESKIINQAGYRELIKNDDHVSVGETTHHWQYYFTSAGWNEACRGLDPKATA